MMLASVALALVLLVAAATAAAWLPSPHFQLAPVRRLVVIFASVVRLLVVMLASVVLTLIVLFAALGGDSGGPGAVAAHPACACEAAGS